MGFNQIESKQLKIKPFSIKEKLQSTKYDYS
jgi:hypothetical protein